MESTNENASLKIQNLDEGFAIIEREFVEIDTIKIKRLIADSGHVASYLGTPFHSIYNLFSTIPMLQNVLLPKLSFILNHVGSNYRCVNATFYNKPPGSNWELDFHQDVTINLKAYHKELGYCNWVKKAGYYRVQPPVEVLENIVIIRIHLDDCRIENGALRIVLNTHSVGFINTEAYKVDTFKDVELNEGDVLIMRPLLLHGAGYNETDKNRRVIHLEFSNLNLPWHESYMLD